MTRIVTGTVEFLWETDEAILLTLDPDQPGTPHSFEVGGELHARIAGNVSEGDRVEVEFVAVSYEAIDPGSGPSERVRAEVRDVRPLGRPG